MKRIIYTTSDGFLAVVRPVRNTYPTLENITEEAALERAMKTLPGNAIGPQILEESAIPEDRTFRNAWVAGDGCVEFDMEKCREIHRDRLRVLRVPKFKCLDVQFQRNYKDPKKLDEIEAKKQLLRDATRDPSIEAAKTPEELKLAVPAVLSAP